MATEFARLPYQRADRLYWSVPQATHPATMPVTRPQLVLFDVNETLLSLAPLKQALARLDRDPHFPALWFNSLLHHSLVCSAAGRYFGFAEIGEATLKMLCHKKGIDATANTIREVVGHLLQLPAHDDVVGGLSRLKEAGITMATLTNSTQRGVETQIHHAGLERFFSHLLSVEQVQCYKPHHIVYRWAVQTLNAAPQQCMMVAAHGWDVAGAQWAGLRGAFIARPGQQPFPLAPEPEIHTPDLEGLAEAILAMPEN